LNIGLTLAGKTARYGKRPNEDTELHVQQLFVGPYLETGMGPQGSAGVELSVYIHFYGQHKAVFIYKK